jgi:F-type H+-transporting ATPase subunit delta
MKSEDRSSAIQYANALLQLTEETGDPRTVFENLNALGGVFTSDPELMVLFKHPSIAAPKKLEFIKEASTGLDTLTAQLLRLLCERGKLHLLPAILDEFKALLLQKLNRAEGTITSAEPISAEEVASIEDKLQKRLNKKVKLTAHVDKSLIGGYVLRVGDEVIDGSLRGRLQGIEKALLSV